MNKCEKCAYYNKFNKKCYRFHISEHHCQDDCNWYERASETKTDKELSVMENDDLVELYYANLSYSRSWENGEAYNDYVYPVKKELEKRGYKVINEYIIQIGKTKVIDCTYNDKSVKTIGQLFPVGFDAIEKDLDRLEKQDKIIEIIKEKEPDISFLVRVEDLNHYNSCVWKEQELTQEEWNLLKEVFG